MAAAAPSSSSRSPAAARTANSSAPRAASPSDSVGRARSASRKRREVDLPRNARGGIMIPEADVDAAFRFFDPDGRGSITLADLRTRLQPFYRDMPAREYKFLMGDSKTLTANDIKELLRDNDVVGFDPVAEAFKVYDPTGAGYIQIDVLRDVFRRLGFDELSEDDMTVLMETADLDRDGKISLEDFRRMLDFGSVASAGLSGLGADHA